MRVSKPLAPVSPETHAQQATDRVATLSGDSRATAQSDDIGLPAHEATMTAAEGEYVGQVKDKSSGSPACSEREKETRPMQQVSAQEQVRKDKAQNGMGMPRVLPVKVMTSPLARVREHKGGMPPFPTAQSLWKSRVAVQTPEDMSKNQGDSAPDPETPPTLPRMLLKADSYAQACADSAKDQDGLQSEPGRRQTPKSDAGLGEVKSQGELATRLDLGEVESQGELVARLQALLWRAKTLSAEGNQVAAERLLSKVARYEQLLTDAGNDSGEDASSSSAASVPAHIARGLLHPITQ